MRGNMKYHIIAIEREYASAGQEIGQRTAKRLGIPCYGREILAMAAKELGQPEHYLEDLEEKSTGSFMYSMYAMANLGKGDSISQGRSLPWESRLFLTESKIIQKLTQTPAVVVGRCAAHSLREREDVLRVFIHADDAFRKKRAVDTYGIPAQKASEALKRADRRRSGYYRANTGKDWKNSQNYHIVLDSGLLGIERCADILETCIKS